MKGACAAERHQVEAAVVKAAVCAQQPDGVGHVLAGDIDDRVRGRLDLAPELGCDPADGPTGEFRVEPDCSAEEVVRIEASEHEIRVRDRGRGASLPVRGRPRIGAGARGADFQQPTRIEARLRAAAGADGGQVDDGYGDGQAPLELELARRADCSVHDDADVGARAAHVEGDHVRAAGCLGEVPARDQAARQAGDHEADRLTGSLPNRYLAAVRLEQEAWAAEPNLGEPLVEPLGKAAGEPAEVRVNDDRVAALVLAPDRRHFVRARHRDPGKGGTESGGESLLVLGTDVGEKEVDRHGDSVIDGVARAHLAHEPLDLGVLELDPNRTVLRDPLDDPEAVAAPHIGHRFLPLEVEERLAVDALDERHVLEPGRRQVERALSFPLEQAVRGDRRSEHEEGDLGSRASRLIQGVEDRTRRIVRRRRHLRRPALSRVFVDEDEIGKRTARVDPDTDAHSSAPTA